jgi:hypothetical protein
MKLLILSNISSNACNTHFKADVKKASNEPKETKPKQLNLFESL